ncbi:hypothetical protein M6D81_08635 [Paenibacillus sp. J5C_2022]|uniref:hypothetical protein n=1 Tax=Paenibacillus sp. J5C2022 TaxID=2977129 RepID=UPI0021CF09FA|nr:hypothetical protein [Paenibacillus sp. J5C2022]MCU6708784.1 hypothetical protein [Paenibacillus sp. J5C2022]
MRKTKWKKIILWTASIVILLGIGGLFAANYAVDRLLASLSDSLGEELIADNANPNDSSENNGTTSQQPSDDKQTLPDDPEQILNNDKDSATDADGNPSSSNNGEEDKYNPEISTDKAKDVQEKITVNEKAKLTAVFLKELSMDDLKALQELASGGLSKEEKKEARNLILEKLSPEQYDDLIEIAKKYGLSQGKSYEEVSKDK